MVRLIDQAKRGGADPNLFAGLVQACRYVGLLEASLAADARARRLEPQIETSVHHSLWMAGQYQEAIDAGAGKPFTELSTAQSLAELGRGAEAIAVLDGALQNPDYQGVNPSIQHAFRALRAVVDADRAAALAALEQIDPELLLEIDPEFLYCVGTWFVPAGDVERGLSLIGKAVQKGFFCLGSPSNRTGRVEWRGGLSSPWQALPEVGGRVPGLVPDRCRLSGLPGMATMARRLRLPSLRPG